MNIKNIKSLFISNRKVFTKIKPRIKEVMVSIICWFYSIFFIFMGLSLLFSGSLVGFFAGSLIIGGSLLIIPFITEVVNSVLSNKTEFKITPKIKLLIALLVLILFVIGAIMAAVTDSGGPSEEQEQNLKGKSAEEVLDLYLSYFDYNTLSERRFSLTDESQMTESHMKEYLQATSDYFNQLALINGEWIHTCSQVKRVFEEDVCGENTNKFGKVYRKFTVLSKDIIEEGEVVKINVKYKQVSGSSPQEAIEKVGETTYFLRKYGEVWKIFDGLDDQKILFSENLELERKKFNESLIQLREPLENTKKLLSDAKKIKDEQRRILREIVNAVYSSVSDVKEVKPVVDNNLEGFIINVEYFHEGKTFVDDYYKVQADATSIFQKMFRVTPLIKKVQITAWERYKDNYGNTQEKVLAKSLMTKETSDKINWAGFESKSLNKVTPVSFYGNSFLKSLEDLRNDLENWQTFPLSSGISFPSSSGIEIVGSLPSDLCSDADKQCQDYRECDLLNMLKSQGMC